MVDYVSDKQKNRVEQVKDGWAHVGCVYEKEVMKDEMIYMVLKNGTALTIDKDGRTNWVVKGWN